MAEFWSIKEAAAYLGVGYKTVYRLVRDGEIPAGKVGGVYRIRKEEVDAYFERQKREVLEQESESVSSEKCAICLRLLSGKGDKGGICKDEACTLRICRACWESEGLHFCPEHRPMRSEGLEDARRRLRAGEISVLVTALEAKQRELSFISRFDQKVHRIAKIRHPLLGEAIQPSRPWSGAHTHFDDSEWLLDLLRTGYLERGVEQEFPLNVVSRYSVPRRKSGEPGLILEARVMSHLPALVRHGFDTRPATFAEVLGVLETYSEEAEEDETAYIVGVASTTGWTKEARDYIRASGSGRSFSHRLVLPCLVDLHHMAVVYNEADQRLTSFISLFGPYLPEDRMASVVEYMRRQLLLYDSLSLSEVAEQMTVDLEIVRKAAKHLVDGGGFSMDEVEGIGSVISHREPNVQLA